MAPQRRLLLWGGLALTLAAAAWVDHGDRDNSVELAKKSTRQVAQRTPPAAGPSAGLGQTPTTLTLTDLARNKYTTSHADLFPGRDWIPPPVAIPTGPAGPPPLPFAYIGKLLEKGGPVLFLLHQERTLAVRQGDLIDGTYRIEKITPQSVVLLYLPLKQQQFLDLGSSNQ